MTTERTVDPAALTRLPDPPPKEPDEVTAFLHFYDRGSNEHLAVRLGNRNTTLVTGDCRVMTSTADSSEARRPDVLIAFGVNPQAFRARGHYVISEQGKPPGFVMEIASESTATADTGPKRVEYAALGIPEYWRFDDTGENHGNKLAGDRLIVDRYEPIDIKVLSGGRHQGYSAVLDLILEWRDGDLNWIDPATGEYIATIEQEREVRMAAEAQAEHEREGRLQAEAQTEHERERRLQAEARIRELEQRLGFADGDANEGSDGTGQ